MKDNTYIYETLAELLEGRILIVHRDPGNADDP